MTNGKEPESVHVQDILRAVNDFNALLLEKWQTHRIRAHLLIRVAGSKAARVTTDGKEPLVTIKQVDVRPEPAVLWSPEDKEGT